MFQSQEANKKSKTQSMQKGYNKNKENHQYQKKKNYREESQ